VFTLPLQVGHIFIGHDFILSFFVINNNFYQIYYI